jgi:maleate isomerase
MANPTVEAEMRTLLPIPYVVARLVSKSESPEERLRDYAEQAVGALAQFGNMPLDAIGFACTGSSYLIGALREGEIAARSPTHLLFAAAAVAAELQRREVKRIALISPYPEWLHLAGLDYWRSAGLDVIFDARIQTGSDDTMSIYGLDAPAAASWIGAAKACEPDAILLSGTGMPTLSLLRSEGCPPVLSSNSCLAGALMRKAHHGA